MRLPWVRPRGRHAAGVARRPTSPVVAAAEVPATPAAPVAPAQRAPEVVLGFSDGSSHALEGQAGRAFQALAEILASR